MMLNASLTAQPLAKPQVIDETQYASSIWYMNPKTGEVESRWTKSESTEVQTYVGIDRNTSEAVFWDQEQEKTCVSAPINRAFTVCIS